MKTLRLLLVITVVGFLFSSCKKDEDFQSKYDTIQAGMAYSNGTYTVEKDFTYVVLSGNLVSVYFLEEKVDDNNNAQITFVVRNEFSACSYHSTAEWSTRDTITVHINKPGTIMFNGDEDNLINVLYLTN